MPSSAEARLMRCNITSEFTMRQAYGIAAEEGAFAQR
jgi:hypothetical protein